MYDYLYMMIADSSVELTSFAPSLCSCFVGVAWYRLLLAVIASCCVCRMKWLGYFERAFFCSAFISCRVALTILEI
jgi:hypothetical protein